MSTTTATIAPQAAWSASGEPRSTIERIRSALYFVPLKQPASDAKVFTGRQKPLDRVAVLIAWITTSDGLEGFGLSYSKRAGGPALLAHAREIAPELLGEDPSDIGRLWEKLQWAGASVGRGGLAVQAIAAFDVALWDLKAKRAVASKKASDLGKATKASWDRAKEGFADAYRDLATAYEKAAAEFKK